MNKQWAINGGRIDVNKAHDILSIQMWVSFSMSWYLLNERRMCARIQETSKEREGERKWIKRRILGWQIAWYRHTNKAQSLFLAYVNIRKEHIDNRRTWTSSMCKETNRSLHRISLLTFEICFYCLMPDILTISSNIDKMTYVNRTFSLPCARSILYVPSAYFVEHTRLVLHIKQKVRRYPVRRWFLVCACARSLSLSTIPMAYMRVYSERQRERERKKDFF